MKPEPAPSWTIALTIFIAIGVCCAGLILTGPGWVHLVPSLPARAARPPTLTPIPSPTPTRFSLPTVTPTPTRQAIPLTFPTMDPDEIPTPEPTQAPLATRRPPQNTSFPGQGNAVLSFSLSRGGATRFTFSHTGESNFIVRLLDASGNYAGGLANEIGNANGEAIEPLGAGDYFLEVEADGQWLVNVIPP